MLKILLVIVMMVYPSISLATTWWDVKNVHRVDGNLEYSIPITKYMNPKTGDVFSGYVVMKYGRFVKQEYSSYNDSIYETNRDKKQVVNSAVGLNGTINGQDVTHIPLFEKVNLKYINHRNKCKYSYRGQQELLDEFFKKDIKIKQGMEFAYCGCPIVVNTESRAIVSPENVIVWKMISNLRSQDLHIPHLKLEEIKKEYWEPNVFNGTYILNGEEVNVDLYKLEAQYKNVNICPLESVYDNSAIFEIYNSNIKRYRVFKENGIYKVQYTPFDFFDNYLKNFVSYVEPTEELISYAEATSKILGIDINH